MNRSAEITFKWADGTYTFRLLWGQIIMLQEACDCGPYTLLSKFADHSWNIQEISHIIRLGLIGGGKTPVEALKLVEAYVENRPPLENVFYAVDILKAGIEGAPEEDDELKKNTEPTMDINLARSLMEKSELPNSMEAAPLSA